MILATSDKLIVTEICLLIVDVNCVVPCHLYDGNSNEKANPEENSINKRNMYAQHCSLVKNSTGYNFTGEVTLCKESSVK